MHPHRRLGTEKKTAVLPPSSKKLAEEQLKAFTTLEKDYHQGRCTQKFCGSIIPTLTQYSSISSWHQNPKYVTDFIGHIKHIFCLSQPSWSGGVSSQRPPLIIRNSADITYINDIINKEKVIKILKLKFPAGLTLTSEETKELSKILPLVSLQFDIYDPKTDTVIKECGSVQEFAKEIGITLPYIPLAYSQIKVSTNDLNGVKTVGLYDFKNGLFINSVEEFKKLVRRAVKYDLSKLTLTFSISLLDAIIKKEETREKLRELIPHCEEIKLLEHQLDIPLLVNIHTTIQSISPMPEEGCFYIFC